MNKKIADAENKIFINAHTAYMNNIFGFDATSGFFVFLADSLAFL